LIPVLLNGVGAADSDKDCVLGPGVIVADKLVGVIVNGGSGAEALVGEDGRSGSTAAAMAAAAAASAAFCLASAIN
jgi:hypothetical protein